MANTDRPHGFTPVYGLSGGSNGRVEIMQHPATDSDAIFLGDLVMLAGSAAAMVTDPNTYVPTVKVGTAGDSIKCVGVCVGTLPNKNRLASENHCPASVQKDILVNTDPNIVMRCQCEADCDATDIGSTANMISTHTGNSTSGRSGQELDDSFETTGGELKILQVVNFDPRPDNAPGTNADVLVRFNIHHYGVGSTVSNASVGAEGV